MAEHGQMLANWCWLTSIVSSVIALVFSVAGLRISYVPSLQSNSREEGARLAAEIRHYFPEVP